MHVVYSDQEFCDLLIADGIITPDRLYQLRGERENATESVSDMLVRTGVLTEQDRARYLGKQLGIPYVALGYREIDGQAARLIPGAMALRLTAIPIERSPTVLSVAMSNPLDLAALDELRAHTRLEIDPLISSREEIHEAISLVFGLYDNLNDLVAAAVQAVSQSEIRDTIGEELPNGLGKVESIQLSSSSPVISLVNEIILRALNMRASDIHVNPEKERVRIRFRIDGIMQEVLMVPKDLQLAVVSRIKIMGAMDIAERRAPQDGRITLQTPIGEYDFRVSSYPAIHGENIVIRVLDKKAARISLEKLGLNPILQDNLERTIQRPYGMILVAGPTGAGKTTTLYACLNFLNSPDRNIMTIEDPVEYQLPGIIQANVNAKAGITFASGLRSLVRQDPDIILVGEIRDEETARIAIEASLTGHLVLSTIHANDSAGAITRLIDMGIEPFLIASSLLGAVSQRLLRVNCARCSSPYLPPEPILERLGMHDAGGAGFAFMKGAGCEACNKSGYRGRTGIYEFLEMNPTIQMKILERATSHEIRELAIPGKTLIHDALNKLRAGQTTPEEIMRVTIL